MIQLLLNSGTVVTKSFSTAMLFSLLMLYNYAPPVKQRVCFVIKIKIDFNVKKLCTEMDSAVSSC